MSLAESMLPCGISANAGTILQRCRRPQFKLPVEAKAQQLGEQRMYALKNHVRAFNNPAQGCRAAHVPAHRS
jgi:hypothetical protein